MITALCRMTVPGVTAALLLSGCANPAAAGRDRQDENLSDQKKTQRPTYQVIVRERARKPQGPDAQKD